MITKEPAWLYRIGWMMYSMPSEAMVEYVTIKPFLLGSFVIINSASQQEYAKL